MSIIIIIDYNRLIIFFIKLFSIWSSPVRVVGPKKREKQVKEQNRIGQSEVDEDLWPFTSRIQHGIDRVQDDQYKLDQLKGGQVAFPPEIRP